jgi:hypothetical protein
MIRVRRTGEQATVEIEDEPDITHGYRVVVQLDLSERPPRVSEITIASEEGSISSREVRRLPLSALKQAAVAAATIAGDRDQFSLRDLREARQRLREAMGLAPPMPRGFPARGQSERFYRELLAHARGLEEMGVAPVADIARRKRVDPNTVRQWLHRARNLEERQQQEEER